MSRARARRVPGTRLALRIYVVILLAFVSIAVVLVVAAHVRHARRWPGPAALGPYLAQMVARQHSNPQAMRRELDRALHDMGIEITVYTADGKLLGSAAKSPPPPGPRRPLPLLGPQGEAMPPPPPGGPLGPLGAHRTGPSSGSPGEGMPPPSPGEPPGPPGSHPPPDEPLPLARDFLGRPSPPGRQAPLQMVPLALADEPGAYALVRLPHMAWEPPNPTFEIVTVLVCLALASAALAFMLVRPMKQIAAMARAFGAGDLSARAGLARADELGEVARAFDEMAERITQLLSAQRELLASVSHEIRTPLARIRVALDLASEGDAEAARQSLGDIAQDLSELEELVEEVLVMARMEAQNMHAIPPLHRAPIDLCEVARHATTRSHAAHAGRRVQADLPPKKVTVDGDANLLRRVIENLLDNACKYSPAATPVNLDLRQAEDHAILVVRDQGHGIGADDLPNVYRPFFRADRSRSRGTGGVGLGLALAKRIVEAHAGSISIESQLDVGTTVTVRIPITHFATFPQTRLHTR